MLVPYILIGIVLAALAMRTLFHRIVVFEFERGVRYDRGRAAGTLEPGVHWLWPTTTVTKVDVRPAFLAVPGQEVLTADGVGLKLTLVAKCQVVDPERALNSVAAYRDALYTQVQLTLREIVSATPVDSILASRLDLGKQLLSLAAPKVAEFGVNLLELEVKDVMFPGDLKKVFTQVVRARQEGLAALERARGETAALRNLANAATLVDQRPSLMQLRVLQTLGQTTGNTVVLGLGGAPQTIPLRRGELPPEPETQPPAESEP